MSNIIKHESRFVELPDSSYGVLHMQGGEHYLAVPNKISDNCFDRSLVKGRSRTLHVMKRYDMYPCVPYTLLGVEERISNGAFGDKIYSFTATSEGILEPGDTHSHAFAVTHRMFDHFKDIPGPDDVDGWNPSALKQELQESKLSHNIIPNTIDVDLFRSFESFESSTSRQVFNITTTLEFKFVNAISFGSIDSVIRDLELVLSFINGSNVEVSSYSFLKSFSSQSTHVVYNRPHPEFQLAFKAGNLSFARHRFVDVFCKLLTGVLLNNSEIRAVMENYILAKSSFGQPLRYITSALEGVAHSLLGMNTSRETSLRRKINFVADETRGLMRLNRAFSSLIDVGYFKDVDGVSSDIRKLRNLRTHLGSNSDPDELPIHEDLEPDYIYEMERLVVAGIMKYCKVDKDVASHLCL